MSKILSLLAAVLMFGACSGQEQNSFVGKEYKLTQAPNNAEITLGFDGKENRYFGKAAVNNYFGAYTLEGENLSFGPAGATMMAGPEPLMKAEHEYLQILSDIKSYKLEGKKLILNGSEGKQLVFEEIGKVSE